MEPGDTVTLASDSTFRGTLVRLPRSVGRKQPRALVQSQLGEQWIPMSELRPVQSNSEQ